MHCVTLLRKELYRQSRKTLRRGGATGEPEQSLESKIQTERYVNGVYEIPLSLNVCVIPSFNTTLRYSNEQVEY